MTAGPPPGWYDDPQGARGSRWWDGSGWTEHTRGGEVASASSSGSNGFSIGAIILGALSFLFFPIVFGPIAIALAAVAMVRDEDRSIVALIVAIAGTVGGFILGAVMGMMWF